MIISTKSLKDSRKIRNKRFDQIDIAPIDCWLLGGHHQHRPQHIVWHHWIRIGNFRRRIIDCRLPIIKQPSIIFIQQLGLFQKVLLQNLSARLLFLCIMVMIMVMEAQAKQITWIPFQAVPNAAIIISIIIC